jgi:hypothetical protein
MPTKEIVEFANPSNVDLLNEFKGAASLEYQSRVPWATKGSLNNTMDAMFKWQPGINAFVDTLFNLYGTQIFRKNSWQNPWGVFKQGLMGPQESIQEIAMGLIKARTYNPRKEYLEKDIFGRYTTDVQTAFHTVNRQEYYPVTIEREQLERAFLDPQGLSTFINQQIGSQSTSDNVDEFEEMVSVFRRFYNRDGFFKIKVPDLLTAANRTTANTQEFLMTFRAQADTMPFMSTLYNPRGMPRSAQKQDLILITTPKAKAAWDVMALAGAFNKSLMEIENSIFLLPDEKVNIPGFQGIMTTRDFFMFADKFLGVTSAQNPVGMWNNYFAHHHELISASPFEPAILFSATEESVITVTDYEVSGVTDIEVNDLLNQGAQVATTAGAVTLNRGGAYMVFASATTTPPNGPNDGVEFKVSGNNSPRTNVNSSGVFVIGADEDATAITLTARASADESFSKALAITLTGKFVKGNVSLDIDEDGDPATAA